MTRSKKRREIYELRARLGGGGGCHQEPRKSISKKYCWRWWGDVPGGVMSDGLWSYRYAPNYWGSKSAWNAAMSVTKAQVEYSFSLCTTAAAF